MTADGESASGAAGAGAGQLSVRAGRVSLVAWAVFAAWALVSFATPATTSDIWVHMRLGEDLLAGAPLPTVEHYSGTAEGRPFVAYEWLSAIALAGVHELAGAPGLMLLRVVVGMACLGFLVFSLAPAHRRAAVVLPLLVLVDYLVCFRSHIRPHLFSLLMVSVVVFALERWRRERRLGELVWLIPLHALWANLHGAYLLGVVLLGVTTAVAGFIAVLPGLASARERFSAGDVAQVGGVALASLAACLLNPYGTDLLELSVRMSESSEFIKSAIWEWKNPFLVGPGNHWFVIYCILLALVWLCALIRLRQRRWLDAALCAVVIYQTMRANRFIPYLGIVAFPLLVRFAVEFWGTRASQLEARLRPWLESALVVFMVATAFGPLEAMSPRQHRAFGWGFSSHFPTDEVAFIREQGYEGVIFNEYGDGGMLIYALYPQVRVVMDPRIDVYGAALYSEWRSSRGSLEQFAAFLEKHGVDLVLMRKAPQFLPMLDALAEDPEWTLVRQFPRRALFVRTRLLQGGLRPAESSAGERGGPGRKP